MYVKTRAIVLSQLRYGDTSLIIRIFTEESGVQSFLLKGLKSNKSKSRSAYFQPLSLLEIEIPKHSKANLQVLKDPRFLHHYQNIHQSIEKQSIFFFLSEVLNKSLHTEQAEKELFNFIFDALIALDLTQEKCNDFHLLFLNELATHLGFQMSKEKLNTYFDLENGNFTNHCPVHDNYLQGESCLLLNDLLNSSFCESNFNLFAGRNRSLLLDSLLTYFKIHILDFSPIRSHQILREILR